MYWSTISGSGIVGTNRWGDLFGIARKAMIITRKTAMAMRGSLYFLNPDGVC
jgi:hypothetical protein